MTRDRWRYACALWVTWQLEMTRIKNYTCTCLCHRWQRQSNIKVRWQRLPPPTAVTDTWVWSVSTYVHNQGLRNFPRLKNPNFCCAHRARNMSIINLEFNNKSIIKMLNFLMWFISSIKTCFEIWNLNKLNHEIIIHDCEECLALYNCASAIVISFVQRN